VDAEATAERVVDINPRLEALSRVGVSIWLDDLSRERIESGSLAALVEHSCVVGVTTNPTIFAAALDDSTRYDAQLRDLAAAGADVHQIVTELTTTDVRAACDVLANVYQRTGGVDGRVSIEVPPTLAFDTEATLAAARMLWSKVDRPNLLIKIPATDEGLPAITAAIGEGISVNVTLIFGHGRYTQVIDAFISGLEHAAHAGLDLETIHGVASFFVSRVDSEIDARLDRIGTPEALSLKGRAAVANARLAYATYLRSFARERFARIAGANRQRPLWASTGVKDPAYPDTLYVSELAAWNVVNTMPETMLNAFADHGTTNGDSITPALDDACDVFDALTVVGIDVYDVAATLEREGVAKFVQSWSELLRSVQGRLGR
jgi:transaldolase